MPGRCREVGPGQCFVCGCDGASPGRLGRAECTGKVRSGSLRRLWQSTAVPPLGKPACLHPRRRKGSRTALGLECKRCSPLSVPLKWSGLTWPCDSDLDLAKRVIALRPGLTASVPLAFLPATFPSSVPPHFPTLEHRVRRPLRSRPGEICLHLAIEAARPGSWRYMFPFLSALAKGLQFARSLAWRGQDFK